MGPPGEPDYALVYKKDEVYSRAQSDARYAAIDASYTRDESSRIFLTKWEIPSWAKTMPRSYASTQVLWYGATSGASALATVEPHGALYPRCFSTNGTPGIEFYVFNSSDKHWLIRQRLRPADTTSLWRPPLQRYVQFTSVIGSAGFEWFDFIVSDADSKASTVTTIQVLVEWGHNNGSHSQNCRVVSQSITTY